MLRYRFYPLDQHGVICGPYSAELCDDDGAAFDWAGELALPFGVEVWQGARLVCRLQNASRADSIRGSAEGS